MNISEKYMKTVENTYTVTEFHVDDVPCVRLDGLEYFNISQIFDCGQCFRFDPAENPRHAAEFAGVAMGRCLRIGQDSPDSAVLYHTTAAEFEAVWKHYFALDADYAAIRADIAARFSHASGGREGIIRDAMECGRGIRILRQEPWETVCSFIISQNNNIPRIKKIIAALCRTYGEAILADGGVHYAFPTPEAVAEAGIDAIFALRTGFRAKYLHDAAVRTVSGELDFAAVSRATPEEAEQLLCQVKGIGPKVAACAMLFGFDKTEAFPVDVWMKRVLERHYPEGLDVQALGRYAGIAQQYLFYYERYVSEHEL